VDQQFNGQAVRNTILQDDQRRVNARKGGGWFGLIFGLSYALVVWGPHAYFMYNHAATIFWAELLLGLIACTFFWIIMFNISGFFRPTIYAMLLGALAGFATPWVIWYSKLAVEQLAGLGPEVNIGEALRTRLFFIGFWGLGVGTLGGLIERILLPRAWDLTSTSGRYSMNSVAVFLVCLPLTVVFGSVTSDYLHAGLEEGLLATYEGILDVQSGQSKRPLSTWRYGGKDVEVLSSKQWPKGEFRISLVDYDAETMEIFFFDVVYADGETVRCKAYGSALQVCGNLMETLQQQMDILIQKGLSQQLDSLSCDNCDPYIKPSTIISLYALSPFFETKYLLSKVDQRGGAIRMMAQFPSGFQLTCTFRSEEPIVVEECFGNKQ